MKCLICIMTSVLGGQIRSIKGQVINHFQVEMITGGLS